MYNIDIKKAAKIIRNEVIDYFGDHPEDLIDYNGKENEELIYEYVEELADRDGSELELDDHEIEKFIDAIFDEIGIDSLCREIMNEASEVLTDEWEYAKNPLKYNGMSKKDFM